MKTKLNNLFTFILLCPFWMAQIHAQSNSSSATLDANNINARISVAGDNFYDGQNPVFEVPKGNHTNGLFNSCLWIGGLEKNNIKIAAMTYRQNGSDFWAGPIDTTNGTVPDSVSRIWDHVYKVTKAEINDFLANGTISASIANWPANQKWSHYTRKLAPYVDVDHNGYYNPKDGDYPDIKGDVYLWWIFNDAAAAHTETGGDPLKVEVHASAYAWNCGNDPIKYNSLFLEYEIFNRSGGNIDSMMPGIFTDFAIGFAVNKYEGTSRAGNSYYSYFSSGYDSGQYGKNPPVMAVTFLNDSIRRCITYDNDFTAYGNPNQPQHYFNFLAGLDKTGKPFNNGQSLMYPGIPFSSDGQNEPGSKKPGFRRVLGSFGPYRVLPNESKKLRFAYTYYRNESKDFKENISWALDNMKALAQSTQAQQESCTGSSSIATASGVHTLKAYPNPAQNYVQLQWEGAMPQAVTMVNQLGQVVFDQRTGLGMHSLQINTEPMAAGIYTIVMYTATGTTASKLLINK